MRVVAAIGELPSVPAIYAMYGGEERRYVAYVGIGDNLRRRVGRHLVSRNSSATTDTGAVRLHPDHVSAVAWRTTHPPGAGSIDWDQPRIALSTITDEHDPAPYG